MDITLIVKASNQQFDDQTIKCEPSWTIRRLKGHLTEVYPGKPSTDEQKLIYSGQLLSDSVVLKDILRHYDGQQAHTVHLVFTPKNNRHRDFNSGGTSSSSSNNSGSTMAPKTNNESGVTANAATGSRAESTRSPETGVSSSSFGADGLRQRNVAGSQNINTAPAAMGTSPIPPASADFIMGQHLAMQNWMQQAYMQYLNQYMNVISNGQSPQALYASAPTNPANPIIPQSSPQASLPQQAAAQPSQNPMLAQTLPNLAYYPYLSSMSSSSMPSASSIPAPITSSGTIPTSPAPPAGVTPGPSSQPSISSPVPASPAAPAAPGTSGSPSSSPVAATTATAATATVQQDAAAQAAPAVAAPPAAAGAAAAAAQPARRFPNIVVEEQENRDWLDIFFSMCRVGILMTVVYLYSSPTRCLTVFLVGIMLYLYHIGFFRNNRADRMEQARRMVVQQINAAHIVRHIERARAAANPVQAGAEAAANAQAPSPTAASASATATQADTTTDGSTKTEAGSSSSESDVRVQDPSDALEVEEDANNTTEANAADEMAVDPSATAPEANRVNINDVAAFLRTLVLSFFTSIIPDTPAA